MHDRVAQAEVQAGTGERIVVLLLPEALGSFSDKERLARTLRSQPSVRVLLCLPDAKGHQFAGILEEIGIETEIPLAPDVEKLPVKKAYQLKAWPSTERKQLIEFALTLCDVV